MATQPFSYNPQYTGVVLAVKPQGMIADMAMPAISPVATKAFNYVVYNTDEAFTVPDTQIGTKGKANEVSFSGTDVSGNCLDYGLIDIVPQDDIDQAAAANTGYDPRAHASEYTNNLILLDREIRVANTVFNPNNYDADKVATPASLWSDFVNSNPISDILEALDVPLMRPNTLIFGQTTWTKLRQNPKVVQSYFGNAATAGVVPRQHLLDLFEVENIYVGASRVNTAKRGQTAIFNRCWGKSMAMLYLDKLANNQRGVTWGMTVPYGTPQVYTYFDEEIGTRGAEKIKVVRSCAEVVSAKSMGYFFQNCIA